MVALPNRFELLALVLLIAPAGPAFAEQSCPPAAAIHGGDAQVRELTAALIDRGVRIEPPDLPPGECGLLDVSLREEGAGWVVAIRDPWGRTAERSVKQLLTAATLIESWARMDLFEAASTSSAAQSAPAGAQASRANPSPAAQAVEVAKEAPADETSEVLFGVSAEGGVAGDRVKWLGARASLCGRIGWFCLGASGRYGISQRRQSAVDLLVDLSAPIRLGRLTLTPAIGIGAGWLGPVRPREGCEAEGGCGPTEISDRRARERLGDFDAFQEHERSISPRVEAGLLASIQLIDLLHLQIGASAIGAPVVEEGRHLSLDPQASLIHAQAGILSGTSLNAKILPLRRVEGRVEELSDEALLAACAVQDRAALGALFDRHHLGVHRFLCRVAGVSAVEAEDLLQDTFAAVWTSAPRYRGNAPASTWLFGIAANIAKNYCRARHRRTHALGVLERQPEPPSEAADRATERREELQKLERVLSALPHDHRVALLMCDLWDHSGNDVAAAFGVRPGTVWRWLHEARKALRSALAKETP